MILHRFSAMWSALAPAFGNHLWQSTLFALGAALLTLLLRKTYARARYWLWLVASVKFLIPFSLLVALGGLMSGPRASPGTNAGLYFAMEQISWSFTPPVMPAISRVNAPGVASSVAVHLPPLMLPALWLCGFLAVVLVWQLRWRRIRAFARNALPLSAGREVETLRRLERGEGMRKPLEIRLSRASLEPGIFGIARPVLIWPEGVAERLEDAQLEAILAHELWHVRRRDNLAAAVHMVVEAVFWFHPLVWWLGVRLVEERERACDQGVLQMGKPPAIYAQSILSVCEFCVESSLACVSGVTGSDLKKRIVRIMTDRVDGKLNLARKLLLSVAGLMALCIPVVFGILHATRGQAQSQAESSTAASYVYEVASIKPNKSGNDWIGIRYTPNGLSATNANVEWLIESAYGIPDHQLSGAPGWLRSERYDIEAKMESAVADQLGKLDQDQLRAARQHMLQTLLGDRCKLAIHRESTEQPVYALVIGKSGSKLHEAKPGDTYPNGVKGPDGKPLSMMMMGRNGPLTGQGSPISNLVRFLSRQLGRKVIDKTGLTGNYDFTLKWAPDQNTQILGGPGGGLAPADSAPPDSSGPSLFTAIEEQLGLKLESQKGPVEMIVIDHIEKPSEN